MSIIIIIVYKDSHTINIHRQIKTLKSKVIRLIQQLYT